MLTISKATFCLNRRHIESLRSDAMVAFMIRMLFVSSDELSKDRTLNNISFLKINFKHMT